VIHSTDTVERIDHARPGRCSRGIGMRAIAVAFSALSGESSPASCCPRSSASSAT
jgi:hypothetical protein